MGSKTRLSSHCTKRANYGLNLVTSRKINTRLARPIVPEAIHNPVAIRLLVLGLLTAHICYVCMFCIYICLTEAGAMHEAGNVCSVWSTYYHFPMWYFTSIHFIIWEVLLPIARWFLTSWGTYIFIMHI